MRSWNLTIRILLGSIVIPCCMISCNNSQEVSSGQVPVVDIEKNINSFKFVMLSEIADDIKYIPLETGNISMIRFIQKLIVLDDRFIIVESNSCKAFDKEGNFICEYGSPGKGPGQFLYISSVSVDTDNKRIYISSFPKLLIEYSYSGDYMRTIEIPSEMIDSIEQSAIYTTVGDNIYFGLTSKNHSKLVAFNDNKKVQAVYQDYFNDPALKGNMLAYLGVNNPLLILGNNIIFKDGLCDTAFYLTVDLHRKPAYYFHFGKYSHLIDYLRSVSDYKNSEELKESLNHIQIRDLKETDEFLLFTCSFGNHLPKSEYITVDEPQNTGGHINAQFLGYVNPVYGMYNRNSSELVFLRRSSDYFIDKVGITGFVNDIDGGVPFWPVAQPYGKQLACTVNAYDLKAYIAGETFKNSKPKYLEKKNALKRFADSLNYDDNPVLMIVTVKE